MASDANPKCGNIVNGEYCREETRYNEGGYDCKKCGKRYITPTSILRWIELNQNRSAIGRASKVLESDAELAEGLREIADIWVAESGGSESPDIDRTNAQMLYDAADRLAGAAKRYDAMEAAFQRICKHPLTLNMGDDARVCYDCRKRILTEAGE